MNFMEASKIKEGTKFNIIVKSNGSGWLDCYFKNGMIYHLGGKLVATVDVFEADYQLIDDDSDWNLADQYHDAVAPGDSDGYSELNVNKCRDLILEDINKIGAEHFGKETHKSPEISAYFTQARIIIKKRFGKL